MEFKETLNLPRTSFPMQAKLPEREPEILDRWEKGDLHGRLLRILADRPLFILHDGPPYANGHLHMGHALNKILKDIINRAAIKEGKRPVYVPGWDCHGLPIEHRVLAELKKNRSELSPLEIRSRCRSSAQSFADIQKEEFRRMGVMGDWNDPYLTMAFGYEATILESFAAIVRDGRVYKGVKPVLWCPNCETALADAEVEYEDHLSHTATVLFPETNRSGNRRFFPIWTTTPWTLPANRAVAINPDAVYLELEWRSDTASGPFHKGDQIVVGSLLWDAEKGFAGFETFKDGFSIISSVKGVDLLHLEPKLKSPLNGQTVPLVPGPFVTLDQGTGLVHVAPGHGEDDFEVGKAFGLEIFAPVDNRGRYTEALGPGLPDLIGLPVLKADPVVLEKLGNAGLLVRTEEYHHSYPHCWRCKKPVIFRATPQWFLSLSRENLREKALAAIKKVEWIPAKGENRISGMIESRPDWCLSRQRAWGIPIPAFHCLGCKDSFIDPEFVFRLADWTRSNGIDCWFGPSLPEELLKDLVCPGCGGDDLQAERDILDVWFDSGVSHVAVLREREDLKWPADLYLEGSDQHRGWFHSSLLTSMALYGTPPYRKVLTHGFVVDGQGRKMAKSLNNVISPLDIVKKYGAEILRLWAGSADYREDTRLSDVILSHLVESYRKIRNTFRFIVSNLYDAPDSGTGLETVSRTPSEDLLDRWILSLWERTKGRIRTSYEIYDFSQVAQIANQFCSVSLSAHYFDMIKDRLYADGSDGTARRQTQAVLSIIGRELLLCLEPILAFTSEELAPHLLKNPSTPGVPPEIGVHSDGFPTPVPSRSDPALEEKMDLLLGLRGELGRMLDDLRKSKTIGSGLEVSVLLSGPLIRSEPFKDLSPDFLSTFFIVSEVQLTDRGGQVETEEKKDRVPLAILESETLPQIHWSVFRARGTKCERCWNYRTDTGQNLKNLPVCARCFAVVSEGFPDLMKPANT